MDIGFSDPVQYINIVRNSNGMYIDKTNLNNYKYVLVNIRNSNPSYYNISGVVNFNSIPTENIRNLKLKFRVNRGFATGRSNISVGVNNSRSDYDLIDINNIPTYDTAGSIVYEYSSSYTYKDYVVNIDNKFIRNVSKNGFTFYETYSEFGGQSRIENISVEYEIFYEQPTISNLAIMGNQWERPITINWRSTLQDIYQYELYYNNALVKSGNGNNETGFVVPSNTFSGTLPASVRVRVGRNIPEQTIWTDWVERGISLQNIAATISNLMVSGEYWEKPINISWQSAEQQQFKIEVFKDNVIQKTYSGDSDTNCLIPADELGSGDYVFKVSVAYGGRFDNSQSRSVKLKDVVSTVKEFSLSGSNIDLPISMSWQSENQEKWEIKVLLGNIEKLTYNGFLETSKDIPIGAITETGLYTFMIRVSFRDRWSQWLSYDKLLTETLPSIGILEPDGRVLDSDSPIRVYWTSINQSRWSLDVNGVVSTGTDELEHIVPAGSLETGRASIELTVFLDISGKEKKAIKKVESIVRGRPPSPTIVSPSIYSNNRPLFYWDTRDQVSYQLQVSDIGGNIIYDAGWINGLIVKHLIGDYIPNGDYIVSVRVKNIYAEVSEWSRKQFKVQAVETSDIDLKVYNWTDINVLKWDASGYDRFYIFRNGEMIASTLDAEYTDRTCQGENIYFVRGITADNIYKDSVEVLSFTDLQCPIVSLGGSEITHLVYKNDQSDINISYNPMSNKVFYSGRTAPVVVHGEHEDISYSIDYSEIERESYFNVLDMVKTKKPILYRSNRYKIWLTFDGVSMTDNVDDMVYSLDGYKIDYSEAIEYD